MRTREWSLVLLVAAVTLLITSFLRESWERRKPDFNVFVDPGFVSEKSTVNADTFVNYMIKELLREYFLASKEESVTVRVLAPLYERGLYMGFGEMRSFVATESIIITSFPTIKVARFINKYSSEKSNYKTNFSPDMWKARKVYFIDPSKKVWFFISQEALEVFAQKSPAAKWNPMFVTHEEPDDSIYEQLHRKCPNTAILCGKLPDSIMVIRPNKFRKDNLSRDFYKIPISEIVRIPNKEDSALIVILFDMSGIYKKKFAEHPGLQGLVKLLNNRYIFQSSPLDTFNIMVLGFASKAVKIIDQSLIWKDFENNSVNWVDSLVSYAGDTNFTSYTIFSKAFDILRNEFNGKDLSRYRTVHIWFITDGIPDNDSASAWTKSVSRFLNTLKNKNSRIRTLDIYFMIPADLPLSQKERKDRINLLNTIDSVLTVNTKQSGRLRAFVKVQVIDL